MDARRLKKGEAQAKEGAEEAQGFSEGCKSPKGIASKPEEAPDCRSRSEHGHRGAEIDGADSCNRSRTIAKVCLAYEASDSAKALSLLQRVQRRIRVPWIRERDGGTTGCSRHDGRILPSL